MKIRAFWDFFGILGIIAGVNLSALAQTEEADPFNNPLPETGMWFPNDGSGTGIILEVQAGILVGALFGADASGDNTWLLFSGELEPRFNEEFGTQVGWMLDATLFKTTDSACIFECPPGENPGAPVTTEAGQIAIEFSGRSSATFRVDDAAAKPIAPFYFGVVNRRFEPDNALALMPDLTGTWFFVNDLLFFLDDSGSYIGRSGVARIGPPAITYAPEPSGGEALQQIVYPVEFDDLDIEGELTCEFQQTEDQSGADPNCSMTPGLFNVSIGGIPFHDITDSRITVFWGSDQPNDVTRTEFFRLGHD